MLNSNKFTPIFLSHQFFTFFLIRIYFIGENFVGNNIRHVAGISSLLTDENFHRRLTFATFDQKITITDLCKKIFFKINFVITYFEKYPENSTFYSPYQNIKKVSYLVCMEVENTQIFHDFKVIDIIWLKCSSVKTVLVLFFVVYNFRHLPNISSLLTDENFTDKIV